MRGIAVAVAVGVVVGGASDAQAFEPKTTPGGELIRWHKSGALAIEVAAPEQNVPGGTDRAVQSLRDSFAPWFDMIPAIDLEFTDIANADAVVDGSDERNTVVWYYDGWNDRFDERALAMTVTTYSRSTGAILDADIAINAQRYEWTTTGGSDCSARFDLQNVMAHEVGHLIGLAHEDGDEEVTMYPTSASCETKKRDLAQDDLDGVDFLYAEAAQFETEDDEGGSMNPIAGCSASSDRSATWLAALVLLMASVPLSRRGRKRRRRARATLAALVALPLASAAPADASTLAHVSVDRMASEASLVVRGEVVSSQSRWDGKMIVTDNVVAVRECWSAGPCPAQVVVRQLGGEVGDIGMTVEGTAPMLEGDEVVLFLRDRGARHFAPVGMAQGVFSVARQPDGQLSLRRNLGGLSLVTETGQAAARVEHFRGEALRKIVAAARRRK